MGCFFGGTGRCDFPVPYIFNGLRLIGRMQHWRQHGYSTERDFVYVSTASLTHEQLQQLSDEVGPERNGTYLRRESKVSAITTESYVLEKPVIAAFRITALILSG